MQTVPVGYLVPVGLVGVCTAVALIGPRPRSSRPGHWSYWLTFLINEQPVLAFVVLLALSLQTWAVGDLTSPGGEAGLALAGLTTIGLGVLVRRALRAGPALDRAMADGLGVRPGGSRQPISAGTLLLPFLVRRGDVARVKDIAYGDAGKRNLLDVYHHRSGPAGGPALVYFHGGGYRSGHKNREGRAMLNRLAAQGWVCVSANYRLAPEAGFPDHLIDAKKVVAWARAHLGDYGGDPATLFVAGSSAGAHLAAMTGLTMNDPQFQPGFPEADTSVSGVVGLYGYYGRLGGPLDAVSSPADRLTPDAPPFLIVHGDQDSSALVEDTRQFVAALRAAGRPPVVYAELPGAQHTFDLMRSVRCTSVIAAVESFATQSIRA